MRRWLAAGAGLLILALGACGTGDALAPPPQVALAADEYMFTGLPEQVRAGAIRFSLENVGREEHELVLVRLAADRTIDDVKGALARGRQLPPPWVEPAGGLSVRLPGAPVGVFTTALERGTYLLACFVPTQAENPAAPRHAELGMLAELTVVGEDGDASLPHPDATITATDYRFGLGDLDPGPAAVKVVNRGKAAHQFAVLALAEEGALRTALTEADGPPGTTVGFSTVWGTLAPGQEAVYETELRPGPYGIVCVLTDQAKRPHYLLGMQAEFTVS